MKKMKKMIRNLIMPKLTSNELIARIKKAGGLVGERVVFTDPQSVRIDLASAFCIEIGNDITIAANVTILAHDYSYSVLNNVYGIMPQNSKPTIIGNNVFLGRGATILMGSTIGDNVVIGAGAVISGTIPSNTIWAGNPARQICTLEEFRDKRCARYEQSAVNLAKQIVKNLNRKPTYKDMGFYIALFTPRTEENRHYFDNLDSRLPNVSENVWNMEQKYDDLDDFLIKNEII